MVYDVTQRNSFEQLDYYFQEMQNNTSKDTQVVLIGNKIDLENDRQINRIEAQQWADAKGVKYFEVSAKENRGNLIQEVFSNMVEMVISQL